jgi:molecular chaperone GrpE
MTAGPDPHAEPSADGTWRESRTVMISPATNFAEVEPTRAPEPSEPDRATMTRALRELEAAQARVERDARRVHEETRTKLVLELLPVLDNLDRTIRAATERREGTALVEGVRLVRAQLENVLRGFGVDRIDAIGARFDPRVHDAIQVAPVRDAARHGLVLEQVEPGYRFGDRLLRPAKVVVGQAMI